MNFKTKDLLVTVLPKVPDDIAKLCLFHTYICKHPSILCVQPCSFLPSCGHCSIVFSRCLHCSIHITCPTATCNPTYVRVDPFVIRYSEDLVALRAELQETLRQLDAIQKEGLPSAIGSKAEADALEQSLNEALKQVKAAQAKFRRG